MVLLSQAAPALLCDLLHVLGVSPGEFATVEEIIETAQTTIDRLQYNHMVSYASIQKWGERAQANQTTEECAELIVALNKYYNRDYNGTDISGVITEIADVEIMCDCMRKVLGNDLVDAEKNRKLERLATTRLDMDSFEDTFK
jgi:predicted MarR family transcription regulator